VGEAAEALWEKTIEKLKGKLPAASFDTWIKGLKPIRFEENKLIVAAPNGFSRDWVVSRYKKQIENSLTSMVNAELVVVVDEYSTPSQSRPTTDNGTGYAEEVYLLLKYRSLKDQKRALQLLKVLFDVE
jgi:chromosomal replication initiator protein